MKKVEIQISIFENDILKESKTFEGENYFLHMVKRNYEEQNAEYMASHSCEKDSREDLEDMFIMMNSFIEDICKSMGSKSLKQMIEDIELLAEIKTEEKEND